MKQRRRRSRRRSGGSPRASPRARRSTSPGTACAPAATSSSAGPPSTSAGAVTGTVLDIGTSRLKVKAESYSLFGKPRPDEVWRVAPSLLKRGVVMAKSQSREGRQLCTS